MATPRLQAPSLGRAAQLSARTPGALAPAAPAARRRHRCLQPTAAASGGSPSWDFQRSASGARERLEAAAAEARQKFEEFARQQKLKERLDSGVQAASKAAAAAAEEAQKTAQRVDAEFDVTGKAAQAGAAAAESARKVNDAAEELESKFHIRRRFRNAWSDFKRTAPQTLRQVRDFFDTPAGVLTFAFLFMVSVFTGAFWVILRWVVSLAWLFILLGPLIINYLNAVAVREQQERYKEWQEEQLRRQQDPLFGTPFEGMFGGGKGASRRKSSKFSSQDVIDVSIDHMDD